MYSRAGCPIVFGRTPRFKTGQIVAKRFFGGGRVTRTTFSRRGLLRCGGLNGCTGANPFGGVGGERACMHPGMKSAPGPREAEMAHVRRIRRLGPGRRSGRALLWTRVIGWSAWLPAKLPVDSVMKRPLLIIAFYSLTVASGRMRRKTGKCSDFHEDTETQKTKTE